MPIGRLMNGYGKLEDQTIHYRQHTTQPLIPIPLTYVGHFQNGNKHGIGVLFNDTIVINTCWVDGSINGYGTFHTPEFDYEGLLISSLEK